MKITIKPLTPSLLQDYLYFFDNITFSENPGWSKCYCFSFHFTGKRHEWKRESNRASVMEYINDGRMDGYMAFDQDTPVGWCNVNDRRNFQALSKYYEIDQESDEKVLSVVCFLIHPGYRRQGIAKKMLERICADAEKKQFDCIEAYPGRGKLSSEQNYKGPEKLYMDMGFSPYKEFDKYTILRKVLK